MQSIKHYFLCHIGTGVTVNAVHPGIVRTEITRYMGIYQNFLGRLAVDTLY